MRKILLTSFCIMFVCPFEVSAQTETQIDQISIDIEEVVILQTNKPKSVQERLDQASKRQRLAPAESFAKVYADFKNKLQEKIGLSYSADVSILGQRGSPNGKGTPWQTQYYGSANWDMFSNEIGSGSLQLAYTNVQYWGKSGNDLDNRLGVVSSVNDYTSNAHYFDQLSYTHQMPGKADFLSFTIGQFPIYSFDGSQYNSNQQINFINYALSQNASSSYPSASLGGYLTIAPNSEWTFVVGAQDATNISGSKIDTHHLHNKRFTSFVSISYTPMIENLGEGQYSILLYNQPGVALQPENSNGWSVNLAQNIGKKWSVFARFNGSTHVEPIKQSYVIGGVYNNPLNRNPLDQIGLATAFNKLNKTVNGPGTRSFETVFEGYWAWGISNFITITPDVQFYLNPGLDTNNKTATVASIRATFMF